MSDIQLDLLEKATRAACEAHGICLYPKCLNPEVCKVLTGDKAKAAILAFLDAAAQSQEAVDRAAVALALTASASGSTGDALLRDMARQVFHSLRAQVTGPKAREPGWYWVRSEAANDGWEPAELLTTRCWLYTGTDLHFHEDPFEIGPRILPPDAQPETNDLERAQARIAELERLVYVPGAWRCAKCEFVLFQSNLNALDGTVTARDDPGDKCPNCDSPLWRVTWQQDAKEMGKRLEEGFEREQAVIRAEAQRGPSWDDAVEVLKNTNDEVILAAAEKIDGYPFGMARMFGSEATLANKDHAEHLNSALRRAYQVVGVLADYLASHRPATSQDAEREGLIAALEVAAFHTEERARGRPASDTIWEEVEIVRTALAKSRHPTTEG